MKNKKVLIGMLSGLGILAVAAAIMIYGFSGEPKSPYGLNSQSGQTGNPADNPSNNPSEGSNVPASPLEGNDKFPGELLGLPLVQYVEGEEAIASIGQLHRTNIDTKEGYIASYQDQAKGQALTIWISVDPENKARELFNIMDGKIKTKNTPFKGRTELAINGLKVIEVTGMGQDHYYWVEGEENVWVALGGFEDSQDALKTVVEALK